MRRRDLERAARRIGNALGRQDCALIGGLAVAAHGYVRATTDVDFVSRVPLGEARRRLRAKGISLALRRGPELEGDFQCLTGALDGVRVDVIPPLVSINWDEAIEVPLTKSVAIRVVSLDALLQLKVRAGGPRDLLDVAALVLRHPERLERAQALAAARGLGSTLDMWLQDPRLQAEMRRER